MKTGYAVLDCMTTKPISCLPSLSIKECAMLMKQHDIGSVLVVQDKRLLGIVTEDDFVHRVVALGLDTSQSVSSIMTTEVKTISPGSDILEATKLMNKYSIRHLPVMDGEKMVGYLTQRTVLKFQPELIELLLEKSEIAGTDTSFSEF